MGRTSLLARLGKIAREEYQAHIVEVDFGFYRNLKNPEGLFAALKTKIANVLQAID